MLETLGRVPVRPDLGRETRSFALVETHLVHFRDHIAAQRRGLAVPRHERLRFGQKLFFALDEDGFAVLLVGAVQPRCRETFGEKFVRPGLAAFHAVRILRRPENVRPIACLTRLVLAIGARHAKALNLRVRFDAHGTLVCHFA
jgi:hypothetical protein